MNENIDESKKPSVFISYCHADREWLDQLTIQLGVLKQEGLLEEWNDNQIETGDDWLPEIENAMNNADVAVLLISAPFLNSNFILRKEVPELLQRRKEEGIKVYPILIRSCQWKEIPWLAKMQLYTIDGNPLSSIENKYTVEDKFSEIAGEILSIIKKKT